MSGLKQPSKSKTPTHSKIQHAIFHDEVVGSLDGVSFFQAGVVDARIGQTAGQVGTGQRLTRHLRDGGGIAQLLNVLREAISGAHVKGGHGCVKGSHGDGRSEEHTSERKSQSEI